MIALIVAGAAVVAPIASSPQMSLVGGADVCRSPVSAGYSSTVVGITFNFGRNDATCERLKLSRALDEQGYPAAATRLLCQDRKIAKAMADAGTPCEGVAHPK